MTSRDPLLEASKQVRGVAGSPNSVPFGPEVLKLSIARELGQHVAGMGSRPGMLGGRGSGADDAGLRCSCGQWALPGDERGTRPWAAYHRHVAEAILETFGNRMLDNAGGALRSDERERLANEAYERGDIGKPGYISVWDWLLTEGGRATPTRRLKVVVVND